jgi:hypothetical protein
MKNISFFLLVTLFSNPCFGDDPLYLPKATPAPYSGYLVPEKTVTDMRNLSLQLNSSTTVNTLLTQEQVVLTQRLTNSQTETTTLSKELATERDNSLLSKVGFFVLGAASATLVAYGVSRAIK